MGETQASQAAQQASASFYDRPQVQMSEIPIGPGIPFGVECISNSGVGIGGAYGAWGPAYDNVTLFDFLEDHLGRPLQAEERLNLSELGFLSRHHLPKLSVQENTDLEIEVGARLLAQAIQACGWQPSEVDGVLIGITGPVTLDYTECIARKAGVPESALKVTVHKACDGAVGGLHLALNPQMSPPELGINIAQELAGKKVIVGGIEGLSRLISDTQDTYALQLFGTGAGLIGVIPGRTMHFLVGAAHEVYDQEGVLKVRMRYPHSGKRVDGQSMIEVTRSGSSIRFAGLQHEPDDPAAPVMMDGPMGMVKLFVRSGVQVVRTAHQAYRQKMIEMGTPEKDISVAVAHHANLKINQLKGKHLQRESIRMLIPWVMSDFGNISAASCMIAFLRQLPDMKPGDHVLIDGFGAGTYYDVVIVEMGEPAP